MRRWQATLILTIFGMAVAASALAGWWYARESTPHQGPIVLISVNGLGPAGLQAYGGTNSLTPAIDALSADAVVFERAYAHSPLTLPAHASILAGQLPFEHGVRDEAGFTLKDDARSLPELLRNRGFETGAAVSSFLLRPESGVAQGFSFFDAELPDEPDQPMPTVTRDGARTSEVAAQWLRARRGHRFLLFVQVDEHAAESAVTKLVEQLKERNLYDQATIVFTADRGPAGAGLSLDDDALRVPLLVKQPEAEGAGRRVSIPVQHIDLLPTVLDFVRAPIPSGLRGRSLRPILDGGEDDIEHQPIYAETLAGLFRFGGPGKFALITPMYRYTRGSGEQLVDLESGAVTTPDDTPEAAGLRTALDGMIEGYLVVPPPAAISASEEDQFAALGYLGGGLLFDTPSEPLDADEESWVVETHRAAATLASQKNYLAAIGRLREIARAHPRMAIVQYQLGTLLGRVGRVADATRAFHAAAVVEPDNPYVPIAVANLLLRARQPEAAQPHAALAIALAEHQDGRARAAAHEIAARVALAVDDAEGALMHAEAAERDDPAPVIQRFVRGRMLQTEGRDAEALAEFEQAAAAMSGGGRGIEGLHLHLGETLARLERFAEAEEHFRAELQTYPRNISAYVSLATLYHASHRDADAAEMVEGLVEAVPTPEGYDTAAGLWVILGEPSRAAALKSEARARFRGGPALARIARDVRR